ncbi:hypothetical protein B0F90DRAFT_291876 [Multifurca ochricompacta]|uniref:Secreted protein n=1 Tax=Multifurca ochricompacta TaxID=376703 RepID=A0AAD4M6X0_9AGAM|nr:hypothetical protein B0F90DRAFT_291876 [Multifurca ochricompacta]
MQTVATRPGFACLTSLLVFCHCRSILKYEFRNRTYILVSQSCGLSRGVERSTRLSSDPRKISNPLFVRQGHWVLSRARMFLMQVSETQAMVRHGHSKGCQQWG